MRNVLILVASTLLLAGNAFAQTPPADAGKGPGRGQRMHDCSKAPDPARCEARRKELKERFAQAREACKGKPDQHACMSEQMCAKARNPAQCQARAKQRAENRKQAMEVCKGRQGDAMRDCMREQRRKQKPN